MSAPQGPIEPDGMLDGIQWTAVALGAGIDIALTLFASLPVLMAFGGSEIFSEDPQTAQRAMKLVYASQGFLWLSFATGTAATVCGAYVGARRAGVHHLRHGGWVAMASVLLGTAPLLFVSGNPAPGPPAWWEALGLLAMLPCGLLGGFIAASRDA
jgi:hypothetical protein